MADARVRIVGVEPPGVDISSGCRFCTRCWKAREHCAIEVSLLAVPEAFRHAPAHAVHVHDSACHFAEEKIIVPIEES